MKLGTSNCLSGKIHIGGEREETALLPRTASGFSFGGERGKNGALGKGSPDQVRKAQPLRKAFPAHRRKQGPLAGWLASSHAAGSG